MENNLFQSPSTSGQREVTQNLRSLAPALVEMARQLELEVQTSGAAETRVHSSKVTDADASGALRGAVEQISSLADRVEKLMDIQSRQLEAADLQLRFLKQRLQTADSNGEFREASVARVNANIRHANVPLIKNKNRNKKTDTKNTMGINLSDPEGIRKFLDRELFDFSALEAVGTSSQTGMYNLK